MVASANITTIQRFTRNRRCNVCGGAGTDPRGQGLRCFGFLSSDGDYVHCTSEEHAGSLLMNPNTQAYAHRLTGSCHCGTEHGAGIFTPTLIRSASASAPAPAKPFGRIIEEHDYRDPDTGELLFQVVRLDPKDFRQRRPDGNGGWIWNLQGVKRQLYRLPELRAKRRLPDWDGIVFAPEGEKDVDRLRSIGVDATCNPGGAEKWLAEYSEELRGLTLIILQDNDAAGERHADQVARSVYGIAASVKVLTLPGLQPGGDVSDWLDAGGTKERLLALVAAAPEWNPTGDVAALQARITELEAENADLRERLTQRDAALAEAQERFQLVLGLDRNPAIKAERAVVKAVAFEMQSAISGDRADADGWVKSWVVGVAENAGVSAGTAGTHIETMARDELIEKKVVGEQTFHVDHVTGEKIIDYSKPPKPRLYMRPIGDVTDLLARAATWTPSAPPKKPRKGEWGGARQARPDGRCKDHPEDGTICPTCRAIVLEPLEPNTQDAGQGPAPEGKSLLQPALSYLHTQDAGQATDAGSDPDPQDEGHGRPTRQRKDIRDGFGECLVCNTLISANYQFCVLHGAALIDEEPPFPVDDAPEPVTFWMCDTEGCGWPVIPPESFCTGCKKRRAARAWATVQPAAVSS